MTGKRLLLNFTILFTAWVFSLSCVAKDSTDLNQQMGEMAQSIKNIYPLIFEYQENKEPKSNNKLSTSQIAQLKKGIDELQQHLEPLDAVFDQRVETRHITLQTILGHLQQASYALKNGREDYAINLLRSTTTLCMACHTQDKKLHSLSTNEAITFKTPFASAEFLYMTRRYHEALPAFQNYIQQRGKIDYDKKSIEALDHILVIYIQVLNQPDQAVKYFTSLISEQKLASNLKNDVQQWIKGLNTLPTQTNKQALDYAELKSLAKEHIFMHSEQSGPIHIKEEQRPFYIWLRASLYNFFEHKASPAQIPETLYWLAISDRVLEYRFFYSLADLYLKQCVIAYHQHPVAKQCYREYENYVTFAYSGSGGTHIPDEIQQELNTLKEMLPE